MIKIFRQLELLFTNHAASALVQSEHQIPSRIVSRGSDSRRLKTNTARSIISTRRRTTAKKTKSDEFLMTVWRNLRNEFFPDHKEIDEYTVTWSARPQKRVLASCNIRRRKIVVAREMFQPSASRWIAPVLYHEMCHAVIGEGVHLSQSGKRLWHGKQFRQLEARHPDIAAMNTWISTGGWAMAVRSYRAQLARRARDSSR